MIVDLLVGMLNTIGGGVGCDLVDQMIRTPEEYNRALYDLSLRIAETAVKPLSAVVIAVMAVLELTRVASRAEGDSELAVKIVGMALFRISLVYWAAANSTVFLRAIDAAGQWVTSGFTAAAAATDPAVAGAPLGDSMRDALDKAGWKSKVASYSVVVAAVCGGAARAGGVHGGDDAAVRADLHADCVQSVADRVHGVGADPQLGCELFPPVRDVCVPVRDLVSGGAYVPDVGRGCAAAGFVPCG